MARPKEFERNRVLDKAVEVFWCQGYEATSVQDLVEKMGINRQSIYDTFGDKHALFIAALDRYEEVRAASFIQILLREGSARQILHDAFDWLVEDSASGDGRGCLTINSTIELAQRDSTIGNKLSANLAALEDIFYRVVLRGQQEGDIRPTHEPRVLAGFLMNTLQGLRVAAKTKPDKKALQDVVGVTLSVL